MWYCGQVAMVEVNDANNPGSIPWSDFLCKFFLCNFILNLLSNLLINKFISIKINKFIIINFKFNKLI